MPQYPPRNLVLPRLWREITQSSYVLSSKESGLGFSNYDADGAVTFHLPSAYPGRGPYAFFNAQGKQINIVASGNDTISVNQTASKTINDGGAKGSFIQLECPASPGQWVANGASQAWAGFDSRYLTPASGLRHVGNRTMIPNQVSGNTIWERIWQISWVPMSTISVGFANWYITGGAETPTGSPLSVQLWLEYPKGTYTQLTWGGANTGTIPSGATGYSDVQQLPFTIPPFTRYWLWAYFNGSAVPYCTADAFQTPIRDYAGGEYIESPFAGPAVPSTITSLSDQSFFVFPVSVLSYSNYHVWAGIGDSLVVGTNDQVFDASGGRGLFGRAMAKIGPYLNMGTYGDRAVFYVASNTLRSAIIAKAGVDRAFLEYGSGDFANAQTAANLLTNRATIRALYNFPIYDTTVTMVTTSSDDWQTASGQTANANDAQRTTFNSDLRSGSLNDTTSYGIVDIAAAYETSSASLWGPIINGGLWIPRYISSSIADGAHPNSEGYSLGMIQQQIEALVNRSGP